VLRPPSTIHHYHTLDAMTLKRRWVAGGDAFCDILSPAQKRPTMAVTQQSTIEREACMWLEGLARSLEVPAAPGNELAWCVPWARWLTASLTVLRLAHLGACGWALTRCAARCAA
jgi:hypothetical protein